MKEDHYDLMSTVDLPASCFNTNIEPVRTTVADIVSIRDVRVTTAFEPFVSRMDRIIEELAEPADLTELQDYVLELSKGIRVLAKEAHNAAVGYNLNSRIE